MDLPVIAEASSDEVGWDDFLTGFASSHVTLLDRNAPTGAVRRARR